MNDKIARYLECLATHGSHFVACQEARLTWEEIKAFARANPNFHRSERIAVTQASRKIAARVRAHAAEQELLRRAMTPTADGDWSEANRAVVQLMELNPQPWTLISKSA